MSLLNRLEMQSPDPDDKPLVFTVSVFEDHIEISATDTRLKTFYGAILVSVTITRSAGFDSGTPGQIKIDPIYGKTILPDLITVRLKTDVAEIDPTVNRVFVEEDFTHPPIEFDLKSRKPGQIPLTLEISQYGENLFSVVHTIEAE